MRGRPKGAKNKVVKPKRKIIGVRLDKHEEDKLTDLAQFNSVSLSDMIRRLIIGARYDTKQG